MTALARSGLARNLLRQSGASGGGPATFSKPGTNRASTGAVEGEDHEVGEPVGVPLEALACLRRAGGSAPAGGGGARAI
jgi:hypothetical protein